MANRIRPGYERLLCVEFKSKNKCKNVARAHYKQQFRARHLKNESVGCFCQGMKPTAPRESYGTKIQVRDDYFLCTDGNASERLAWLGKFVLTHEALSLPI